MPWVQTSAPLADWYNIACSSTGTFVIAVSGRGIYTSIDSGNTWNKQTTDVPLNALWYSVASDSSGINLVVISNSTSGNGGDGGCIYTSNDSGNTWNLRTSGLPSSANWSCVASDSTGKNLIAAAFNGGVYISNNSGVEWTLQTNSIPQVGVWLTVASDSNGVHLMAGRQSNNITDHCLWISTNSGSTWVQSSVYYSVIGTVCNSTGDSMFAILYGSIWKSVNSGSTWTQTSAPIYDWNAITSDSYGSAVIAVVNGGYVWASGNSGSTWEKIGSTVAKWYGITTDSNGANMFAIDNSGGIYKYIPPPTTLPPTTLVILTQLRTKITTKISVPTTTLALKTLLIKLRSYINYILAVSGRIVSASALIPVLNTTSSTLNVANVNICLNRIKKLFPKVAISNTSSVLRLMSGKHTFDRFFR